MAHKKDLIFMYDFNYQQLKIKDTNDWSDYNTPRFSCSIDKAKKIVNIYFSLNTNKRNIAREKLKVVDSVGDSFTPDLLLCIFNDVRLSNY